MTRVLVSVDSHIYRKEKEYWARSVTGADFFERYCNVFEEVYVASRVGSMGRLDGSRMLPLDANKTSIREIPMFFGSKGFLSQYVQIRRAVKEAVKNVDCAIFRLPSVIGFELWKEFRKTGKPYAIEIVADPSFAYQSNVVPRFYYQTCLKKAAREASGVSYVTRDYLQDHYPSALRLHNDHTCFESYYSSIDLNDDFFGDKREYHPKEQWNIVHSSNIINNNVKGHRELIEIVKLLNSKGLNVSVSFAGDGAKKVFFEDYAKQLGVSAKVKFVGMLVNKQEMRSFLQSGDIFVLPTKNEGVPRSMIEAMAVGLPCAAFNIAGIPELLEPRYTTVPGDVKGLASIVEFFIKNPSLMTEVSAKNISIAKNYESKVLSLRRTEFYRKLKSLCDNLLL